MITRYFIPTLLLLFLARLAPAQQPLIIDGPSAIVNDQVITRFEVSQLADESIRLLQESMASPDQQEELQIRIREARLSALNNLIERQLIIQDFKKTGGFIPDTYINSQIESIIRNRYGGDRLTFIKSIQERGSTMEKVRTEISDTAIVNYMRSRNILFSVLVSPYQVEKYYQDHLAFFQNPEKIKVSTISLRKPLFPSKRTDASGKEVEYDAQYELAQQILDKINSGDDFADLAKQYSEGSNKDQGGMLGWVTQNGTSGAPALREDLWPVVVKMQPGQVSDIISTSDGWYYILMVNDRKKASMAPMEDVRKQIESAVINEENERRQQVWMDGLRSKAFIKMF